MLAEIEEEEPTGYIRFDKFLPMMTKILMQRKLENKVFKNYVSFI